MKTITERDGKNVNMRIVGDLHQYEDGSVHIVKDGKAVWGEVAPSLGLKAVTALPDTGEVGVIYLVPNGSSESENYYDEYIWNEEDLAFEKFGGVTLDLSDYVTNSDLNSALNGYVTNNDLNSALNGYVTKGMITSGTTEYEDGVTNLDTGKLYFQYEV